MFEIWQHCIFIPFDLRFSFFKGNTRILLQPRAFMTVQFKKSQQSCFYFFFVVQFVVIFQNFEEK